MAVFDQIGGDDYEQVVYCHDRASGLRAIIAIHSTLLGPALGGTRFYPYATEEAALVDVLNLARAMTYKAAVAGLDLGGGKAVILGDPATDRSDALVRAYARQVDSLGGRYLTAEDVGTTRADMDLIRQETRHVTGVSEALGGSGDPSGPTAYGVLWAMRAVARHLWGATSLQDRHVVVSGVGNVGRHLVGHLVSEGARVSVSDVDPGALDWAVSTHGVEVVGVDAAHRTDCDIFSPCALGGALDHTTIGELRCAAVVGSANNQLADADCADLLDKAGVLFATDYVVNAGGLINIAEELAPGGYSQERAYAAVQAIFDTTATLLATAEHDAVSTSEVAARLAERRMQQPNGVPMSPPASRG
ncbi:MAG: Glu/Leu/Phe/Val dehydrogenase [Acidimicrobiia bacterium]|nr:Glu/Leu/Phe/Val dehydrogenase [Acidimicrobiia bacterium]